MVREHLPGRRVDNSNHLYSYSFAQKEDWPLYFSTQEVLHEYFRDVRREFGVRQHIRFSTEVLSARGTKPEVSGP